MNLDTMLDWGYRPFSPSQIAEQIDGEIASRMRCRKCGGKCRYEPWTNETGSYIAMAICVDCGHEVEF